MQRDVKAIATGPTNILYSIRMEYMEEIFLLHPFQHNKFLEKAHSKRNRHDKLIAESIKKHPPVTSLKKRKDKDQNANEEEEHISKFYFLI